MEEGDYRMLPLRNMDRFFHKALKQPLYAIRVARRRYAADLAYRFGNGLASYPESITIFLTYRCNLRCKMCGQWGESGVTKMEGLDFIHQEMNLIELTALINEVRAFKPNITLFGGEPFLHNGCIELINQIKARGMHCLVITNGYMVEELAERILESGLNELNVSLDGPADLHDEIRGCPGLFSKIMAGLKKLHRLKAAENIGKPLVNLQCTITKYNYCRLDEMLAVARDAGADSLTFHNLIFLDKTVLEKQAPYDKMLGASSSRWKGFLSEAGIDPEELWRVIEKIQSNKGALNVDFYPNFSHDELIDYYTNPNYVPRKDAARCLSPWIAAYIFPDGEMRPCLNSTYSYGNIKTRSFKRAWNSAEAVKFRQELKKTGIFPVCARCTELYRY